MAVGRSRVLGGLESVRLGFIFVDKEDDEQYQNNHDGDDYECSDDAACDGSYVGARVRVAGHSVRSVANLCISQRSDKK